MSNLPFDQLRPRLCGPLITPADADYETSREIWNRLYDRRPRAVVRCESASDVIEAVRFAREYDLDIAVKGGGHHAAGYASINGGILLNLAGMCSVTVSPAQQRAVAQTGITWAQFDQVDKAFGLGLHRSDRFHDRHRRIHPGWRHRLAAPKAWAWLR